MGTQVHCKISTQCWPIAYLLPIVLFQCFSDPTHVLRNYLAEKGMIDIRVSGGENATDSALYKVHPKIKLYKNGVAQPGVLCVKPDATVVYAWAIDPSVVSLSILQEE